MAAISPSFVTSQCSEFSAATPRSDSRPSHDQSTDSDDNLWSLQPVPRRINNTEQLWAIDGLLDRRYEASGSVGTQYWIAWKHGGLDDVEWVYDWDLNNDPLVLSLRYQDDRRHRRITAQRTNNSFKPSRFEYLVLWDGEGLKWSDWVPEGDTDLLLEIREFEHKIVDIELRDRIANLEAQLASGVHLGPRNPCGVADCMGARGEAVIETNSSQHRDAFAPSHILPILDESKRPSVEWRPKADNDHMCDYKLLRCSDSSEFDSLSSLSPTRCKSDNDLGIDHDRALEDVRDMGDASGSDACDAGHAPMDNQPPVVMGSRFYKWLEDVPTTLARDTPASQNEIASSSSSACVGVGQLRSGRKRALQ